MSVRRMLAAILAVFTVALSASAMKIIPCGSDSSFVIRGVQQLRPEKDKSSLFSSRLSLDLSNNKSTSAPPDAASPGIPPPRPRFTRLSSAQTVTIPYIAPCTRISFSPGSYPVTISMKFDDGSEKSPVMTLKSFAQDFVHKEKEKKETPYRFTDSGLETHFQRKFCRLFSRAKIQGRYHDRQKPEIVKEPWKYGKPASESLYHFEVIRPVSGQDQLWVNGSFYTVLPTGDLNNIVLSLPAGAEYAVRTDKDFPVQRLFQPVRLGVSDPLFKENPGSFPLAACTEEDAFPTARCRENLGSYLLECDGYLSRTAFDGMPDCFLRRVPVAQYIRAHVLCSLENDPGKTTEVTARLTSFYSPNNAGCSPDMITQQTVILPRNDSHPLPENVKRIRPGLYLVTFNLDAGKIQDLIFMKGLDGLDFEVLGGLDRGDNYYLSRADKPSSHPSAVRVLGATLEKSPATLFVTSARPGNICYPGETPSMTAHLSAVVPGGYTLRWIVKDVDGKTLLEKEEALSFAAPGEKAERTMDFPQKDNGYYTVNVRLFRNAAPGSVLKDLFGKEKKEPLLSFDGAFVRLAPDTRKAGYESPYFSWNFGGAHGTPSDPAFVCDILKRAGVRHTQLWNGKYSEADMKEYKLTTGPFTYYRAKGSTPEERAAELDAHIRAQVEKYPSVNVAMIFHESGGGPLPQELTGGTTEITPEQKTKDEEKTARAVELARAWRRNAPHVRLVVGNSGSSLEILAQLFREKYPADLIDTMGEESVGQTSPPERSVAGPFWNLRELARVYGYKDLPVECSYEWKGRKCYTFSPRERAAWSMRDILIAHAWRSKVIPVPTGAAYANCYENTVWGGGAFSRWPLYQPRPGYCATAVLTQLLDRAEFIRMIPTGSLTVYALEFKRGNDYLYALWTARGEVKAAFTTGAEKVLRTDLFGRERVIGGGCFTETVGTEPFYLTLDHPLDSVSAAKERAYPQEPHPEKMTVAAPMDDAAAWEVVTGEDERLRRAPSELQTRIPGTFALSTVKDEKMGRCIEVTPEFSGKLHPLVGEFAFLRLKEPVPLPGTPDTLGVWVKGNSSWGKLHFEIEDAEGEIWFTGGRGTYYDWPEKLGINFDGWHFLQFPLTGDSPVKVTCPGENQFQWRADQTTKGDRKMTYPLKLRAIGLVLQRKSLNLLEMEEVTERSIRFRDFSVY